MKFYELVSYEPLTFERMPYLSEDKLQAFLISDKGYRDKTYSFGRGAIKTETYYKDFVYEKEDDLCRVTYVKMTGEISPKSEKKRSWFDRCNDIYPYYTDKEISITWSAEPIEQVVTDVILKESKKNYLFLKG